MNRPIILPNQLLDIVLNHGFNSHTLRVHINDFIKSLERRQRDLIEKESILLRSKIKLEFQKNIALLGHAYTYSHYTSQRTLELEEINYNFEKAQYHLEIIHQILRLLDPNPLIEFYEDTSNHLGQCPACEQQYEKDRLEYRNLEPLAITEDFHQKLVEIEHSTNLRYPRFQYRRIEWPPHLA